MSGELILTMHTLNKYGIPCEDATYYNSKSFEEVSENNYIFYLSKYKGNYVVTQGLSADGYLVPEKPEEDNPATGIVGFVYCDFHDNVVDYYSFNHGKFICTGSLPGTILENEDVNLNPAIHIETKVLSANLDSHEAEYQRFECDDNGNFSSLSNINLLAEWPYGAPTFVGTSYYTLVSLSFMDVDWWWNGFLYDDEGFEVVSTQFSRDTSGILPCYSQENFFTVNTTQDSNAYNCLYCIGSLYKVLYTSTDGTNTLALFEKVNLLIGDVKNNYQKEMEIQGYYDVDFFDAYIGSVIGMDTLENYKLTIPYFDTLSGIWSIGTSHHTGSRILFGRYFDNILFICVKEGNNEIWFNRAGRKLYDLTIPSGEYVSDRVDYKEYFYYVVSNSGISSVYRYHLNSGNLQIFTIPNTHNDGDGYQLLNRQILGGKYLAVYSGSNYCSLLDIDNLEGDIQYYVRFPITLSPGFHVTSAFKNNKNYGYGSSYNPYLLVLCNSIRTKKMKWSPLQFSAADNHALWCTQHGKYQHEGPGDTDTIGARCKSIGIYSSVSENIMLVFASNPEKEQMDAFKGWCESPHHYANILYSGNGYMCFASRTYPESVTEIETGAGMFDPISKTYLSEGQTLQIPEYLRGKVKIYVQNFIIED